MHALLSKHQLIYIVVNLVPPEHQQCITQLIDQKCNMCYQAHNSKHNMIFLNDTLAATSSLAVKFIKRQMIFFFLCFFLFDFSYRKQIQGILFLCAYWLQMINRAVPPVYCIVKMCWYFLQYMPIPLALLSQVGDDRHF